MTLIKGENFAEVYEEAMKLLFYNPEYKSRPRGLDIHECLNVGLYINDITQNLFRYEDKSLTFPTGYVKKEMCLYLMATHSAQMFSKASSFWNNIKNSDGTINSAYGNLIFNESLDDGRSQFDWAYDSLKNDKDSRQAFMRYNNTSHQFDGNKDLPCTFIQCFHIRDNKLHSTVEMRSNDIIKGTTYDIPSFILFQRLMYLRLKEVYSDLKLGSYTHFANSLHAYSSDFELIEKRLTSNIISNGYPMPNDWRCIKSDDISKCFDIKANRQQYLFDNWEYESNKDFYEWLCK
jgi:thymidylate synthase